MTAPAIRTAFLVLLALAAGTARVAAQDLPPPDVKVKEKPKEGSKPRGDGARAGGAPAPASATLLLSTDERCSVSVDGEFVTTLAPMALRKVSVSVGQHVVSATTDDRKGYWEQIVEAKGAGQIVVKIDFSAGGVVAGTEEFDKRLAQVWVTFSDMQVAADHARSVLGRSFGFHDQSVPTAIHTAHQALKRELDDFKARTPRDAARKAIVEDVVRAAGEIQKYVDLVTKSIASAQSANSWMGEPNNTYAQAVAMLPGAEWTSETWKTLRGSQPFKTALPKEEQLRLGFTTDAADFDLGAESLEVEPMRLLIVRKGSLADSLGLKPGDNLLSVGGRTPASIWELKQTLREKAGSRIAVRYERQGKTQDRQLSVPSRLPAPLPPRTR